MNPSKASSSIIQKIKEQHLKPKARWVITLRHSMFWIFFVLSVFIGAKAIALTFHVIAMSDVPGLFRHRPPPLRILMQLLPLFWIASFILFVAAASWLLQHTPKGYKWTLPKILTLNILLSIVIGFIFYTTGFARILDRRIISVIHPRVSSEHYRERLWNHPKEGFLRGNMMKRYGERSILLRDPRGRDWHVEFSSGALEKGIGGSGMWLRMRGEMTGPDAFRAEGFQPDRPPPPFGRKPGMRRPEFR